MQEGENEVLLTDLCAICHINPIKYTCPRCGIHTCSLPCVKRHKSWAQCSGKRDPTAYRKRADLATPASVDQDFNFISSVERSLQRADDLTSGKGIDLVPSGLRRDRKSKFDKAIAERGIRVIKAPQGLSRNKQNKSHWAGVQKGIAWTTEWIHFDGRKRITMMFDSNTIEEAFRTAFGRKQAQNQKRKRSISETHTAGATRREPPPLSEKVNGEDHEKILDEEQVGTEIIQTGPPEPASSQTQAVVDEVSHTGQTNVRQEAAHSPQDIHFYRFKANTTSKVKCLIPIAADSKVADVLRNCTLLEFPTLYVRLEPPEALPAPFMTEEKYSEDYGTDVSANLQTFALHKDLEEGEVVDLEHIDEGKVLEVLQKDLNG